MLLRNLLFSLLLSCPLLAIDVKLASTPSLSPNGEDLVFSWRGDLWKVKTAGGEAKRLTSHPASDLWPHYSEDGKKIAFVSNRNDIYHAFTVDSAGGAPKQWSTHSMGQTVLGWWPNSDKLIIRAARDQKDFEHSRFFSLNKDGEEELLFNTYGTDLSISANAQEALFTRETGRLYRKRERSDRTSQIWHYDFKTKEYKSIIHEKWGARSPLWKKDMTAFYYLGNQGKAYNLYEYDFETKKSRQMTFFEDDSVMLTSLSADGSKIVFRHLFDFYSLSTSKGAKAEKIDIHVKGDFAVDKLKRRWYDSVWNEDASGSLKFSKAGDEVAFTTGGDLWLMSTKDKKPVALTQDSSYHDTEILFNESEELIYFLRDHGDNVAIWQASRSEEKKSWSENVKFKVKKISADFDSITNLVLSPDGKSFSFVRDRAELCVSDLTVQNIKAINKSAYSPWAQWSPDSKYLLAQVSDSTENSDIWIFSIDGKISYNLSRHPSWDWHPSWSPDGRTIVWGAKRYDGTYKMFYVYLYKEDADKSKEDWVKYPEASKATEIDFEGLYERVVEINTAGSSPESFAWSFDSKAIAYTSTINNVRGTYKVYAPNFNKPELITRKVGTQTVWKKSGIYWLTSGLPAKKDTTFGFEAFQEIDRVARQQLIFRMIWRNLKINFYDENMHGRDWQKILKKYEGMAAYCLDSPSFTRLVNMLNGELNASHLGWTPVTKSYSKGEWKPTTFHTGLLFAEDDETPGLKIKSIVGKSPASKFRHKILAGERLLKVNGQEVLRKSQLTRLMTFRIEEPLHLTILSADNKERIIELTPISYDNLWSLMRADDIRAKRKQVEVKSKGLLGYLNIEAMTTEHLRKFEKEVYSRSFGKEGLVIDVRNNPGGFISDKLLAILCHPNHATTIPRGGEKSYPLTYLPKVIWTKNIIVLCNQNSTSNAEIFSHAIKTLKRGKIVGVTSGAKVISMPKVKILDVGTLAVPDRGWWPNATGINMEESGVVPDYIIWPKPGDPAKGIDRQLDKAIEVLCKEIEDEKAI